MLLLCLHTVVYLSKVCNFAFLACWNQLLFVTELLRSCFMERNYYCAIRHTLMLKLSYTVLEPYSCGFFFSRIPQGCWFLCTFKLYTHLFMNRNSQLFKLTAWPCFQTQLNSPQYLCQWVLKPFVFLVLSYCYLRLKMEQLYFERESSDQIFVKVCCKSTRFNKLLAQLLWPSFMK